MKIVSDECGVIGKDVTNNELKNGIMLRLLIWRASVICTFCICSSRLPEQPKISQYNIELTLTTSGEAIDQDESEGDHIEGDDNQTTTGRQVSIGNKKVVGEIHHDEENYPDQLESEGPAVNGARIWSSEHEFIDVSSPSEK